MFESSFGASAPIDKPRQQYRTALEKQLRAGLEHNHEIDLRFANHHVVVAFTDEPILPIWHRFALAQATDAHVFIAPPDFESGHLTMLSLVDGGAALTHEDIFVEPTVSFGGLIERLREHPEGARTFNVIDPPASVYHDGLAYRFTAGQCVDV